MGIKIINSAFKEGELIPEKFTCRGKGTTPDLQIAGVPANSKCLVLIVDDPDAPAGLWTHYLLANIDPTTTEIAENAIPPGAIVGQNTSKTTKYESPCPPSGIHRYYFKVFALDSILNLSTGFSRSDLNTAMLNHVLAQDELMGRFGIK